MRAAKSQSNSFNLLSFYPLKCIVFRQQNEEGKEGSSSPGNGESSVRVGVGGLITIVSYKSNSERLQKDESRVTET
mgnify:CR=1 FL=1